MKRTPVFVALVLLLAGLVWVIQGRRPSFAPAATTPPPAQHPGPTGAPPPAPADASDASHLADSLNAPTADIRADLRVVGDVLEAFRSNFPHDGNPVGSNAEIAAALTGHNKLHLALIPATHRAINSAGELCDRWGTPFFFHAESGTRMEIRSAGPDKKMWTADDVVLGP